MLTISGALNVRDLEVPLVAAVGRPFLLSSSRSRRPPRISRDRGAGLLVGEYWGRGGAEVILLVRTLISRFGWMIVSLMLKGATS